MKKSWSVIDNKWFPKDISSDEEKLSPGVHNFEITPKGELYLNRISDNFKFDFKVYGLEKDFIDRVIKTYNNTTGNLGVILNGVKGTGKTITAKVLSNKLNLPVILVGRMHKDLNSMLLDIHQDVVVMVDEYEKVFKSEGEEDYDEEGDYQSGKNSSLLSIMDGAYSTEHRKVFILTTNHTWINDNLLNRPGRVRYLRNFSDLSIEQVKEVINDCLKYKEYEEDILDFLKPLSIITVDIVKTVVSEVNIFNESPMDCCKDFNLKFKDDVYTLYKIGDDGEEVLDEEVEERQISILLDRRKNWKSRYFQLSSGNIYYIVDKPDYDKKIYTVSENNARKEDGFKIRVAKKDFTHKIFSAF